MQLALFVIFSCAMTVLSSGSVWASPPLARATLINSRGAPVGMAEFRRGDKNQLLLQIVAKHLSPGPHGIHLHAGNVCTPPDFQSAGGHFNPTNAHHGLKQKKEHHAGDFPNLEVPRSGDVSTQLESSTVSLDEGPRSLFTAPGTTLVIHAGADDQQTDPAGNSGERVMCGEIKKL